MEFNSSPGDLMELSPLFSDDRRVAEAAAVAQKLRKPIVDLPRLFVPSSLHDVQELCILSDNFCLIVYDPWDT